MCVKKNPYWFVSNKTKINSNNNSVIEILLHVIRVTFEVFYFALQTELKI